MIKADHEVQTLEAFAYLKTIKVLLVAEDHADYVQIKKLLSQSPYNEHYTLVWSNKYTEAINAMLKKHYDLYLVDCNLGEYSGIDLLNEAICSNCSEPIIMLSDKADIKADREALRIGASDYLVKENMDAHTLERSIRYSVEHSIALKNIKGSEKKFRTLFERSTYPIVISDYSGKLYDANQAAVKFFELPLDKLLTINDNDFYPDQDDRQRFTEAMEEQGAVNDFEVKLRLLNGEIKFCSISSFVQISQHGTTVLYHSIINDLTSKKEQESSIAEKIAISELIAKNLANEIQNPLSNVNVALTELHSNLNGKGKALKKYIDVVKENCDRIDQLAKNLSQSVNQL